MKKLFYLLSAVVPFTVFNLRAQVGLPPSNMYENLGIYGSVAVYEDGEQIPFQGTDYFYLDFVDDDDVWVLFWSDTYGWLTTSADLEEETYDYTKFSVMNPADEVLTFIVSPDRNDIMISKEYEDVVIAYQLINGGGSYMPTPSYSTPNYGSYGGSYGGGYSTGSSSSGRTCAGCSGTGKCTLCDGKGWYYQETGYYTGNSHKEKTTCPSCHGTGRCGTCHGNGTIR